MHSSWTTDLKNYVSYNREPLVDTYEQISPDLRARVEICGAGWEGNHDHVASFVVNLPQFGKVDLGLSLFVQQHMMTDFPEYQPLFPRKHISIYATHHAKNEASVEYQIQQYRDVITSWSKPENLERNILLHHHPTLLPEVYSGSNPSRSNFSTAFPTAATVSQRPGTCAAWIFFYRRCITSPYHNPEDIPDQAVYPTEITARMVHAENRFIETNYKKIMDRVRFIVARQINEDSLVEFVQDEEDKQAETEAFAVEAVPADPMDYIYNKLADGAISVTKVMEMLVQFRQHAEKEPRVMG